MARPAKSRTLDSFPHPCGRDHWDHKLATFEVMYGTAGYAFYYKMLEAIYSQEDCTLVLDERTRRILIDRLRIRPQKFDEMLKVALDTWLFDPNAFDDRQVITNRDIQRNAAAAFRKREAERRRSQKRREAAAGTTPETPQ